MNIEKVDYINTDYADDLISRLKGLIFHLTRQCSFTCISAEKRIRHNQDGGLPVYPGSDKGFGRRRGWVSFFDFRNPTDKMIAETLDKYYFLGPNWFRRRHPDFLESKLAYLFLSELGEKELVLNYYARETWKETGEYEQHIPDTECWYPGDVPLNLIAKVLLVRVFQDAPKDNPFLYEHHMLLVKSQE